MDERHAVNRQLAGFAARRPNLAAIGIFAESDANAGADSRGNKSDQSMRAVECQCPASRLQREVVQGEDADDAGTHYRETHAGRNCRVSILFKQLEADRQ